MGAPINLPISSKSSRAYLFPQSIRTHYFCNGPVSVDPICQLRRRRLRRRRRRAAAAAELLSARWGLHGLRLGASAEGGGYKISRPLPKAASNWRDQPPGPRASAVCCDAMEATAHGALLAGQATDDYYYYYYYCFYYF